MAHLVMIAIEEGQETRLRSGGALDAAEAQVVTRSLNVAEVPKQFLKGVQSSLSNEP
jgi:hypothetical protein